ncbi:hypothetical protein C2G38_2226850 [Gigaspora rosea]|uniref:Tetratricopeptide repeat protein n=1 Tax=Gigaspora rosea TaxID=44941 RepID=A0A397U6T3_9GLOM|nr:hypothetical protein C2G38_2226850 [Gigaspora rosea]CAG8646642.1 13108_t:CDS:1 [Gigaspora rosea]
MNNQSNQEKFNQQVKNLKHENSNKSDLEIYLEIAKKYPKFLVEAKYKIAYYYKTHEQYENALKIAKEIPENYKNIKMLMAKCYSKIGDEESALKHYEEIANNQIKDSDKNKKFNEEVNHLKMTNMVRNDFEIWQQVAKYDDKTLSAVAKEKMNEYKNIRKKIKQNCEQLKKCDS